VKQCSMTRSKSRQISPQFLHFLYLCQNVTRRKWLQISPLDKRKTGYKKLYQEMQLKRADFIAVCLDVGILKRKYDQVEINNDTLDYVTTLKDSIYINTKNLRLGDDSRAIVSLIYFDDSFSASYPSPINTKEYVQASKKQYKIISPKRPIPSQLQNNEKRQSTQTIATSAALENKCSTSPNPIQLDRISQCNTEREDYIRFCKTLDFSASPRRNRYDGEEIVVKNRNKQVNGEMKNAITMICIEYG